MTKEDIKKINGLLNSVAQTEIEILNKTKKAKELELLINSLIQKKQEEDKILFQHLILFFLENTKDINFEIPKNKKLKQIGNIAELLCLPEIE